MDAPSVRGSSEVSHVAALALRELQAELQNANDTIDILQREAAVLRQDARQLTEEQHAAVVAAESRAEQVTEDNQQLRGLLMDLRAAVEGLVQDNARLQAAASPQTDLQAELQTAQEALAEKAKILRDQESKRMAAEQVSRAAEAAASRSSAALDAAKQDAADAHDEAVRLKGALDALQRQMSSQAADHERQLQAQQAQEEKLRRDQASACARADRADMRAVNYQAAKTRISDLEGKLVEEQTAREQAQSAAGVSKRCITAVMRDAACLQSTAEQLTGQLTETHHLYIDRGRGDGQSCDISPSLSHAEGLSRRMLMLSQVIAEALDQDGQVITRVTVKSAKPKGSKDATKGNENGLAEKQTGRRQVDQVVASLEDELAVLDERYAQILKTAHQLQSADNDSSSDSELETRKESVAQATMRILEAMQKKGAQIRHLRAVR
ncbi:hypothetical protein WJX73_008799 [Symbiochloris irregularis]|uniref:Uncharacterized protein n=1 Tax=Symbiochloris irregularis TaxID=706552 RepID=A0AAW1PIP2_9CHLO